MDVVGFGESSVDQVYCVDGLPQGGRSKVRTCVHYSSPGGQVATTMAACAALGMKAAYLGVVGNDENARRVEDALRERHVDTTRTIRRDAPNRCAVILVDRRTGERIVVWDRDPGLDVPPADLGTVLVTGARIVHVDATDEPASIALARLGREAGAIVTCDIDEVTPRTRELMSFVDIPIFAEHVPRMLTGIDDTEGALLQLRASHPGLLCVTRGARGSAALDARRFVQVPAVPVVTVDTTGAGDVFRAGLIYGLVREWPTDGMLRFANAAAAVSCTRRGAMSSVPTLAEVEHHLR